MIIYTVKPGDTLYGIARKYGVTLSELERFNGLPDTSAIAVGEDILVPVSGTVHTVTEGESLYSISIHENIPLEELISANPELRPPYTIFPGQEINIPASNRPKKKISVNGYTYPNINQTVLERTLPYLTYLSIFSYSAGSDGTIGNLNDETLIATAKSFRTAPVMVVTNTEPGGGFRSELAHAILIDDAISDTLIDNIIRTATAKGYMGVDIDFEYIYPDDKQNYNDFLSKLRLRLDTVGLTLSTAVAPKYSEGQIGTLYEAHDYRFHGTVVDYIIIMTYEWGYLYGPPMAVAPYGEVKKVISYAVTEIPSEKILMGMPNYGYDWTLPYTDGRPANILSIDGALRRALTYGAEIKYSNTSDAPFYEYSVNGVQHIVWFENARSITARLNLVNDFNLGGVSYWTINQFNLQNWRILEDKFDIRKVLH